MTAMPNHDPTLTARRLREDHSRFARTFSDLCERANSGDWHELDEVWRAFTEDVEAHLTFEENDLFPGFSAQNPTCRALVQRLGGEHTEIRRNLDVLGVQIQLKEIRAATIEAFIELMRGHADLEDRRLYPWIAHAVHAGPSPRSA
jgi:hemerythrin-like domain-containing protein